MAQVLYMKGMKNSSESDGEEDGNNIWDDRKLNVAYDKALGIHNADVAKRVAMKTNSQIMKGSKSKGKGKTESGAWKSGMPCRAIYEEDGLEYEAFVLRIINDKECVVRFLGYENSEIVSISSLKPTQGTKERTRQIQQALDCKSDEEYRNHTSNADNMDSVSDRVLSPNSTEKSFQRKKSGKKKKTSKQSNGFELPDMPFSMPQMPAIKNLGGIDMPLPPPPPMPLDHTDSEDQAISSMLLSWYMSGYYTGLYQGLKRAKENRRNV